jgi:hypothetical protein
MNALNTIERIGILAQCHKGGEKPFSTGILHASEWKLTVSGGDTKDCCDAVVGTGKCWGMASRSRCSCEAFVCGEAWIGNGLTEPLGLGVGAGCESSGTALAVTGSDA